MIDEMMRFYKLTQLYNKLWKLNIFYQLAYKFGILLFFDLILIGRFSWKRIKTNKKNFNKLNQWIRLEGG